ncbi:MAG: histidinol-phosphatase [Thermomicrobiales bacterium]
MTLRTNYHTHSRYCDGEGEIAEYIEAAIAAGLDSYGVSCHAPVPILTRDPWLMRLDDLPAYCAQVRRLRDDYRDRLAIFLALELDYAPGLDAFYRERIFPHNFDYFVGSVHFVGTDDQGMPWEIDESAERFAAGLAGGWHGDVRRAFEEYFRLQRAMVGMPGVAIVGHMDKMKMWNGGDRYFRETDTWYVAAVEETLRAFKAGGLIVELNTSGLRKAIASPFPSPWILARCRDLDIPITVTADTHRPADVAAGFPEAAAILRDLGITHVVAREGDRWVSRQVD